MITHLKPLLIAAFGIACLTACKDSTPPTSQEALLYIQKAKEFTTPFFAPINIGTEILTSPENANPQRYIQDKYKSLIDAQLLQVEIAQKNSWRTVLNRSLTTKGKEMEDPRRAEEGVCYVMVCRLRPTQITRIDTMSVDSIIYNYEFEEFDITPFGKFLEFKNQRTHKAKALAHRRDKTWEMVPLYTPTVTPVQPTSQPVAQQ